MTEWIEQDKKDENHLYVHLKDPSLLDLSIFNRMSNVEYDKRPRSMEFACSK